MTMFWILLVAQVSWHDGIDPALEKAREQSRPVCAVWVDDEAASRSLLKLFDQDEEVRKLAGTFVLAKVRGPRPEALFDLPLPLAAVVEPALVPREKTPVLSSLFASARGRLSLSGELTARDDALADAVRKSGRGGSQKIGPMPLKDCFSIVSGWIHIKHELKEAPLVLDPSVPAVAALDFEGGPDHTFESILKAMSRQNGLVLYPRGGKIVLAARLPAMEIEPAALRTFLARHSEPEELPREEGERLAKAVRDLSEDDLAVRDAALKALGDAGSRARRLLRKSLADTRDADVRSRLEQLLRPAK